MKIFKSKTEAFENSPDRLKTLADGVFSIVMTLLVLELSVPEITGTSVNKALTHGLLEMWPRFLIYGLSFMILGIFWLIHHIIFESILRFDTTLCWINIVFLMFVALIPFSTLLFGEYGAQKITALIYGVNMLLLFWLGLVLHSYAHGKHRSLDTGDVDPNIVKGGKIMGLIYTLIMIPAIGISLINPVISFFIYFLIVLAIIFSTMLGKWEKVMVWPVTPKHGK